MSPNTEDKYVGIEIEFLSHHTRSDIQLRVLSKGYDSIIDVGTDSSVRCTCKDPTCILNGHEIRVLTKQKDLKKNLYKVGEILKDVTAEVNHTCGLHVHLDMRNRNFELAADKLFKFQNLMFDMSHSKRSDNRYCREVKKEELKLGGNHYSSINTMAFIRHRTIEVRMHEGSVNVLQIHNWCRFLIEIISRKSDELNSIEDFSRPIRNYIVDRISMNDKDKEQAAQISG